MSRMLEEIRQQPAALARTLTAEARHIEQFKRVIAKRRPKLIVLASRGTSDNAAHFGRYLLEIATGIPVSLAAPSIYTLYNAAVDFRDALVVGISQSGESTDTILVLERARAQGTLTIGITNEASSAMAKLADEVFLVRAEKEMSVAATKTYTGQVLMLYLLAHALGADIRLEDLRRLPDWAESALALEKPIAALCERYRFMDRAVVVGRGLNYANAFEFALKLMETCYVVAERFSSADFLHGPIAMIERHFPVILFAPPGVMLKGTKDLIGRLHELRADTLAITGDLDAAAKCSRSIIMPREIDEFLAPIPYIIPAQLFAALLAEDRKSTR